MNLVAADKDFAKVLVGMLKSLKQAGSPKKAAEELPRTMRELAGA